MGLPASNRVKITYNDHYDEWDIDSGAPKFIHTVAQSRSAAIKKAKRVAPDDYEVLIKGPRMNRYKKV